MSTEGADSGYISNWLSPDCTQSCGASQSSLNEGWALVTRSSNQARPRATEREDRDEYDLEEEEPDQTIATLKPQRGTKVPDAIDEPPACSTRILPTSLFHDLHNARSHLEVALQREMDSRKRSLSSIQYFSRASAKASSTDGSMIESLRNRCLEDSIDLSERYNDLVKAQETFELVLRRTAEHEDRVTTGCNCFRAPIPSRSDHGEDGMSDTSDSSSKAPPVLERYFELAGEQYVAEERINELDVEHEETLMALGDQRRESYKGVPVYRSDEAEQYRLRRRELTEARGIAHRQLQLQRDICLSQGINPERYRYRRVSAPGRKRFSGRDLLQRLKEIDAKLVHDNVNDWLDHNEGT